MRKNVKYILIIIFIITTLVAISNYTYSLNNDNLLSSLDISIDEENNLTTTKFSEIDDFLKNPYKGYSSEDAYSQLTKSVTTWGSGVDEFTTEGYLRLNWYLFYKDTYIGPTDAKDYNDSAYDWTVLYNLIKLYADHDMQLRFGVMTANTTSTDNALAQYKSNPETLTTYYGSVFTDSKLPKGSIIPVADYIPVITKDDEKVKLTCGEEDCSIYDSSTSDNSTYTMRTISDDEVIYKARNITPMWMFEGIPKSYDESGNPLYDDNAVKWYLEKNNLEWLPKWDDENLINNINDFVYAMSNYLKNEEYNGHKLIDYISFVEVRSYGNYGENHIDGTALTSTNNDLRNPLLCDYLDTSAHNYLYAYEKDENFTYPSKCYFDVDGQNKKIYNGMNWHLSYTDTIKYSINISFEYYYEKYLKTYIEAFKDTDVRVVFNWYPIWDSDYYYDAGYVINGTIKELIKSYNGYLTIRGDSIFSTSFGEGYQFEQASGISPSAFEYIIAHYKKYYDKEDYFPTLKTKITENNLCDSKYNCLTNYFVNVVENGRSTYMDYNYILYDYYQNYLNNVEDDYLLDLDYLGNSLGYHFVMKEASFTTKVNLSTKEENLSLNLKVVNDGVTYLYDKEDTKVYLALLKTDGNGNVAKDVTDQSIVIEKFLTDIDPTTWSSSLDITGNRDSNDSNNWISENVELKINDVQAGKYILALGIFTNFDDNSPTIKLGNNGKATDNWYALGEIELNYDQYIINYDNNGGSGVMPSTRANVGEELQLAKNTFTKNGYLFNSWNTKADGTGASFTDEETIIDLISAGQTITLFAIWDNINTSTDYEGIYDGQKHTFNLNLNIEDYNIKYSINNLNYDLSEIPKFSEVGEYIINYKITYATDKEILASNKVKIYGIERFDSTVKIDEDILIINNQSNSFEELKNKIKTFAPSVLYKHYDQNNNLAASDTIGTGHKIQITINNEKIYEYYLSLLGDSTGDGIINIADVIKIADHSIKQNILVAEYDKKASDVTHDNIINISDVIKIADYTLDNSIPLE